MSSLERPRKVSGLASPLTSLACACVCVCVVVVVVVVMRYNVVCTVLG